MFRKILYGLILTLIFCNVGWADYLGIKKSSETIAFFVKPPLDSLYGIQRKPDSVHIFTYADNATTATYSATSTTYPFSDISMDTLKHLSDTMYVFSDAIADIDGAGGNFTLSINVQMYYDKTPTHTYATVQVIADSLNTYFTDSTIVDVSAAMAAGGLLTEAAQATLGYKDTAWTAATIGDQINDQSDTNKLILADVKTIITYTDGNGAAGIDADISAATTDIGNNYLEIQNFDGWNPASDSVNVDVSAANAASGLTTVQAATNLAVLGVSALVEDSTGNSTTRVQSSLIEATDNHFNGMMIVFHSTGDEANQARRITDYDGTAGWVVWTPALTGTPSSGDVFTIVPWASVSATATISDADMGAIGDTIWLKDTTGLLTAGLYGLEATTGAAASLSDAAMGAIADSVWDKIFADAINVAGGAGDSLMTIIANLLDSLNIVLDSVILYDTRWDSLLAVADHVAKIDSTQEWVIKRFAIRGNNSTEPSFFVENQSTNILSDATLFSTKGGAGSGAFHVVSTDGSAFYVDGETHDILLAGTKRIQGFIDSAVAVGGVATGTRTMTFVTLDTGAAGSGENDTLSNIMLEVIDKTGNTYYKDKKAAGRIPVPCNDNDTFLVYGHAMPTYNFLGEGGAGTEIGYDSIFIVNGDTTIDVPGYAMSIAAPGSADLCRMGVFVRGMGGEIVTGVRMRVQVRGSDIMDTCASPHTPIVIYETYGNPSDADSGFTYVDVIKSKCLLKKGAVASAVKYKIGLDYGTKVDWIWEGAAPDEDTYNVTEY